MKKLMILAVVAVAAACANAASVAWNVSGITAPSKTVAAKDVVGYWLEGSSWSDFSKMTDSAKAAYAIANGSKGTTATVRGATSVAGNYGSYSASESVSGYFVLVDSTSNPQYYAASSSLYTGTIPSTGSNLSVKLTATSWKAIPEPTSGLLLLLGVAGLALKRRRA